MSVDGGGEYRIEELARAAGMPVRTVRYYRERRLLPAPRRAGRVALYSAAHLARLKVIAGLLDRGHTLDTVAELLSAWEQGHDVAELIGFESAVTDPWSVETPVRLTIAELDELMTGQADDEALRVSEELGYLRRDGDQVTFASRRLLDTVAGLLAEGIPLPAVLAAARKVQRGLDELASVYVDLFVTHLLEGVLAGPEPAAMSRLTEAIDRLRPLARTDIDVEFGRAMDRRVRHELENLIGHADAASRDS